MTALALCAWIVSAVPAAAQQAPAKPNILVIWGDDIGQFNISSYNLGMMGYKTPNIDSIARDGALFTDWYGQQSCTAGRAAFITGQSPIRTGLTKVGLPGAPEGMKKEDPTIATLLKPLGYMTATVRHGTEEISGRLPSLSSIPSTVSGVQIPQLANDNDAKLAMALIEMLTGERQHLGLKSYAVYALPGLALLLAAVVTLVAAPAAPIIVSGLSAAVAAVGSFKLATVPTETLLVAAKIGPGLWLSMAAYAVLAVAALLVWAGSRRNA